MTQDLFNLLKKKKNLWHANRRARWKSAKLLNEYKCIRNNLKKMTRYTLRRYEIELANDKKNPKRLFAYINSKKKLNDAISAIKTKSGNIVTEKKLIASELNDQFASVFVEEHNFEGDIEDQSDSNLTLKLENVHIV